MFERFTDRARKTMAIANQEAQRFRHEYIGTEHILLGLVKEGSGVAARTLDSLGIDLRKVRLEVEKIVKSGHNVVTMGKLPQTPRAKKVIEYAIDEARNLNHNYVGTEHLLLGLLREADGVAAQVLIALGLSLEEVRAKVIDVLGQGNGNDDEDLGNNEVKGLQQIQTFLGDHKDKIIKFLSELESDTRYEIVQGIVQKKDDDSIFVLTIKDAKGQFYLVLVPCDLLPVLLTSQNFTEWTFRIKTYPYLGYRVPIVDLKDPKAKEPTEAEAPNPEQTPKE